MWCDQKWFVQFLGHVLKGRTHTHLFPHFFCPSDWNRDVLAGGRAAILTHAWGSSWVLRMQWKKIERAWVPNELLEGGTVQAQTFKGKRIKLLFVQPLSIFGFCYSSQTYTLPNTQCFRLYTPKICMLNMVTFGGGAFGEVIRPWGQSFHELD